MMVIYTDAEGEPILPSDLQTSIVMRRQHPSFAAEAPALQYIAFMAKHGPFKDALVARWEAIFAKSGTESIVNVSTEHMMFLKSLSYKRWPMALRSLRRYSSNELLDSDLDCMILILQLVAVDIKDIDCKDWQCGAWELLLFYTNVVLVTFPWCHCKEGEHGGTLRACGMMPMSSRKLGGVT